MADNLGEFPIEIRLNLGYRIIVPIGDDTDYYDDNYVQTHHGSIILVHGEKEIEQVIGEIEIRYIDGERAIDNGLDIVEICDELDQEAYEYAFSIYEEGALDREIVGETVISEDALILHSIALLPAHRGNGYGLAISQRLIETIGCRCGAVLLRPAPLQFSHSENREWMDRMEMNKFTQDRKAATDKLLRYWKGLQLRRTKHREIYCVSS